MSGPELTVVVDAFRAAMRRFTAAVTIVSLSDGGNRHGMTATAVTSVSMAPPSLLACVNNAGAFYRSIAKADRFCVNVLQRGQTDVSQAFSSPLAPAQRFAHGCWESDAHGVPFLTDAQASLLCRRVQLVPFGSHCIVIGEVYDARCRAEVMPLLYCDGGYAQLALPSPTHASATR